MCIYFFFFFFFSTRMLTVNSRNARVTTFLHIDIVLPSRILRMKVCSERKFINHCALSTLRKIVGNYSIYFFFFNFHFNFFSSYEEKKQILQHTIMKYYLNIVLSKRDIVSRTI